MTMAFPRTHDQETKARSCNTFYDLASEVTRHIHCVLLATTVTLILYGRRPTQGSKEQQERTIGGHI